jgi:hypothetical protein
VLGVAVEVLDGVLDKVLVLEDEIVPVEEDDGVLVEEGVLVAVEVLE